MSSGSTNVDSTAVSEVEIVEKKRHKKVIIAAVKSLH